MKIECDQRQIEIDGKGGRITLKSLIVPQGQITEIIGKLIKEGLQAAAIICFGTRNNGEVAHIVYCESAKSAPQLADLNVVITKADMNGIFIDGFYYASFISVLMGGINIAAFDQDFVPSDPNGKIFAEFLSAVYDRDISATMFGSDSSTLLLIARQGKRVLCGKLYAPGSSFVQIETPVDASLAQTFDVIGREILICASVGTRQVHATSAAQLVTLFETGEILQWKSRTIAVSEIEDFSLTVDNGRIVLLTAKDAGRRLIIPTIVAWDKVKGFQITLCKGDCAYDLSRINLAPQRVETTTGLVVARQNNGGLDRVKITTIEGFQRDVPDFDELIELITSGRFASTIAATA
ncbi:hypothetical protein HY771_01555 [Candidatus Uhrbacteria bacterium]|nr:hypothetical protein [Candidatus Uhrbacteria bacterium]